MASKEKLVPLPVRVPETYMERIANLEAKFELDRSEIVRRALRLGMDQMETGTKIAENPLGEKLLLLATMFEGSADERAEMTRAIRSIASKKKNKKQAARKTPRPA